MKTALRWRRQRGINWYYTWIYIPIAGIGEDIRNWWYWRSRCGYCGGEGTVDLGDYGESYVEECPACAGTGSNKHKRKSKT